jgi:hypothetical protein
MKYKILRSRVDWTSFEKNVQTHLDQGWRLLGAPKAVQQQGSCLWVFQAMTLEDEVTAEPMDAVLSSCGGLCVGFSPTRQTM